MAVTCGMPTPATMRVVQIDPGPDADLHGVGPVIEHLRAVAVAIVAADSPRRSRHCA